MDINLRGRRFKQEYRTKVLTLQRGVTSAARHGGKLTCRGMTSTARNATLSHLLDNISTK
jgi:hypothetical protein